ncbi:acid protease [Zopfia rhizophila CBS 207.26]|uniref:Acid protease n=1 Tax=Zopfia rhizophila CBS 207.26 TaxID=1314779 RepID=A0A6A6DH07_9PEZI|nr:acid protease [Zopfia rhizophila CBS 207.26]
MPIAPRATPFTTPAPYVVPPTQDFDGNDGSWSTFKVNVGTPGQDFRVLASTKSGETYVIVPEGCFPEDGADCPSLRGAEQFNSAQSPGFQLNMSSTWSTIGQYSLDLEAKLNYSGQGIYGYDRVALGPASESSSLSLDKLVVAGVAELSYWMGHIPLGIQSSSFSSLSQPADSFLVQMRNQSKIPSLSYSYTAGAKYRSKGVFGSLVLGGYDSTRFKSNTEQFSYSFASDASRLLTVAVLSMTATNTLGGTMALSSGGHLSLIDSTVPHLWLPRSICDNFELSFGLTYDPTTDLYTINSTMHEKIKSLNPSVTIKLANSISDTGTNYSNIVLPYAAFDLQASHPHYPNATNYFPIRRAANDTQYVLGRTLLQEAYLIVDYERSNFTIAQATFPDPLPAQRIVTINPPLNSTSPKDDNSSSKPPLSTGAIAGIAAGGAILILLIIAGAIAFHRKRKGKKKKYELANTQISEAGSAGGLAAHKDSADGHDPQELGGTPLTELATPHREYAGDNKTFVSPQSEPQELPTSFGGPGWRGRTHYHEMDGESTGVPSQVHSRAPSEDSRYISPITPRY